MDSVYVEVWAEEGRAKKKSRGRVSRQGALGYPTAVLGDLRPCVLGMDIPAVWVTCMYISLRRVCVCV